MTNRNERAKGGRAGHNRILAVASYGGHWQQMMLMAEAFAAIETVYATTVPLQAVGDKDGGSHGEGGPGECSTDPDTIGADGPGKTIYQLPDCNKTQIWAVCRCLVAAVRLMRRIRPSIVVSTGAAPGALTLLVGRFYGCDTIWIDSIANSDRLSLSGRLMKYVCRSTYTQWPHLADNKRVVWIGSVL